MRTYETAIIWSTSLTEAELEKELAKVKEIISAEMGSFVRTDSWGRRQLAYPISKQTEGIYFFLNWEGDERVTTGIDKYLRINDGCLRYLTLRKDVIEDVPLPPPSQPSPPPASRSRVAPAVKRPEPEDDEDDDDTAESGGPAGEQPSEEAEAVTVPDTAAVEPEVQPADEEPAEEPPAGDEEKTEEPPEDGEKS